MVKVEFLGPIGRKPEEMSVSSLKELSERLLEDGTLKEWLPKCAVAVNDTMVSDLDTPLKSGDKVTILPPVCGG